MSTTRRVTDPRALQALAHPLRVAILEHLMVEGALTATELADRLDESPANCSWHLRKLAEHEFVEEAPAAGGRRRPWRATVEGISFPDDHDSPAATRAALAVSDLVLARALERFRRGQVSVPEEDRGLVAMRQTVLRVTHEEAEQLERDIADLLRPYQERRRPEDAPEGARLLEHVSWTVPVDDELGPRRER